MLVRPQPREIIQPDRRLISPRRTRGALPGITRPAIMRARSAPPVVNTSLWTILQNRGLDANCKLCLDAADSASYSGSGQNFNDLSGTGTHFYRGETSGSEGTDPTFNGSAGGNSASEYFSSDGNDDFACQLSLQTWMNNLHKASAVFTFLAVYYHTASAFDVHPFFMTTGDNIATASTGFIFGTVSNGAGTPRPCPYVRVGKGSSPVAFYYPVTSVSLSLSAWNFVAISFDEGAGVLNWSSNSQVTKSSGSDSSLSYISPSSGAAPHYPRIWRVSTSPSYVASGARLAMLAAWEGVALSEVQQNLIREDIKTMRSGYGLAA